MCYKMKQYLTIIMENADNVACFEYFCLLAKEESSLIFLLSGALKYHGLLANSNTHSSFPYCNI